MMIPKKINQWMIEQLHLVSDNVHIDNIGESTITATLYAYDGTKWTEQNTREIKPGNHQWFTLKTLSPVFPWQPFESGDSVLVVRADKIEKGKQVYWRVDNMYHLTLQAAIYTPSKGYSRTTGGTLLGTASYKANNKGIGYLNVFGSTIDGRWEYWYSDELIPNP